MANNNMSPSTGEVITKSGEVVNLVDVLGGAQPVDETVYDIRSYSPRTGLILGSDGKAYDLLELLQGGGSGPSGDCVTKEELEEKFAEKLQPIMDSVTASEGKVAALDAKVEGIDVVSIDMIDDLQKKLDESEQKVDALWKLSQGQVYDFIEKEENGMSKAPKGAMYMTLEEIRGMTTQDNYHMGLAIDAGTVEGCAEAPIRELKMFGRTEQKTTNGYQLLQGARMTGLNTELVKVDDYSVKGGPKATSSYYGWYMSNSFDFEDGESYTVSATFMSNIVMACEIGCEGIDTNRDTLTANEPKRISCTFTGNSAKKVLRFYFIGTAQENTIFTVKDVMLERGAAAHDFEPFTGGIPSPNPDYPQEIQSVEQINVRVCGKNLNANIVVASAQMSKLIQIKKGVYTFSTADGSALGPNNNFYIGLYDDANKLIQESGHIRFNLRDMAFSEYSFYYYGGAGYDHFTLEFDDDYLVGWGFSNQVPAISGYQVEKGTTITEYEPYKEQVITIIPPKPLHKVGEYADICDVENGVWEFNTKEVKNLSLMRQISSTGSTRYYVDGLRGFTRHICMCNKESYSIQANYEIRGCRFAYEYNTLILGTVEDYGETIDGVNFIGVIDPSLETIRNEDLLILRRLYTYPSVSNVSITDQNGNDISSQFRFLRDGDNQSDDVIAPTPLYPSEIKSIEKLRVVHQGFDNQPIEDWVKGFITQGTDGVPHYNASYPNAVSSTKVIPVKKGDKVYIRVEGTAGLQDVRCRILNSAGMIDGYIFATAEEFQKEAEETIVSDVSGIIPMCLDHRITKVWISVNRPIDELYEERIIIPPRPMNKIGSYADMCDVDNGEWIYHTEKSTGVYTPLPNDSYLYGTTGQKYTFGVARAFNWDITPFDDGGSAKNGLVMCDVIPYVSSVRGVFGIYRSWNNVIICFDSAVNTVEEVNALFAGKTGTIVCCTPTVTMPINSDDLSFLRSLELLPADHHIVITDQDGNDISYLMEYIRKLSEVAS